MFPKRRSKQRQAVSPAQRLCGLVFSLCIVFQTPLFSMPVRRQGYIADIPLSALEVASIGVLAYQERFAQAMQLVLFPGVWWKLVSKQVVMCLVFRDECEPAQLLDGKALLQACDYKHLVDPYFEATGAAAGMLALASGMLLACAVAMPVVPNLPVSLVALVLFAWSVFQTGCTPLPTLAFLALLGLASVFGYDRRPPAATAAPGAAGAKATPAKKGSAGAAAGKGKGAAQKVADGQRRTAAAASPAKKRK